VSTVASPALSTTEAALLRRPWYHTIDLGGGLVTPGIFDHRPLLDHYGLPADLTGLSVLDAGAANGFFSFEFERRGAQRVLAIDLPMSEQDQVVSVDETFRKDHEHDFESFHLEKFRLARRLLGSQVERREIDIYDLTPEKVGVFDIVFCGSVLMHLSDPFRALRALRSVCRQQLIVASNVWPYTEGERPTAEFVHPDVRFCFWIPTLECLRYQMAAVGCRAESKGYFTMTHRIEGHEVLHGVVHGYIDQ
jgi:tRNA (mo5U34)-methyltransferase